MNVILEIHKVKKEIIMRIMKLLTILTIIVFMLSLSACSNSFRTELFTRDDHKIVNTRFQQIINALDNKESEKLKNLFSSNALKEAGDIDKEIEYLMKFYKGKMISKDGAITGSDSNNYGKKTSELVCNYEIETDMDNYVIYYIDVLVDTEHPNNVGLYMLEIKKLENKNDKKLEWGGEVRQPGIYIPSKIETVDNN